MLAVGALVVLAVGSCDPAVDEVDVEEATAVGATERLALETTIPELQDAMDAGEITAAALVEVSLARIAAYDTAGPQLEALIVVNPRARDEAAALDAERAATGPRGSLHGIPVVIKDNINTADMPTTAGSVSLEGFEPGDDAFQVRRLREAGAVIIGKANLFEFARGWRSVSSLGGQTLSPYDLSRDPGGSSGGSAVAVAAGFAAAGLGTDTCGSVRLPAAWNNLYGLRPTIGLSSRTGVMPLSTTLDTVGPMARSVVDLAIVLEATAGVDPDDPVTVPLETSFVAAVDPAGLQGKRIGVLDRRFRGEVGAMADAALEQMAANGAELIRGIGLPSNVASGSASVSEVISAEFRDGLDDYLSAYPHAPVGSLEEVLANGLLLDEAAYAGRLRASLVNTSRETDAYHDQLARRDVDRQSLVALMDDHNLDALAYPGVLEPATPLGRDPATVHCEMAPWTGTPAIAIPAGSTSDGLPAGLELIGRPFDEPTLIAIAAGYEAHTDHRTLPPTTPPLNATDRDGTDIP